MEGLWETEQPASFSLFAIIDEENQTTRRDIRLPYMLSVLAHNDASSEVKGMKDLQREYEEAYGPGNYVPPVTVVYWSFRIMVGLGTLFILYSFFGLGLWWKNRLETSRRFLQIGTVMMFMPLVANSLGWIVTEIGRQPWVVYGLMFTRDGVSPNVSGGSMLLTTVVFTLVYGLIAAVAVYLVHRFAKNGLPEDTEKMISY